MNTIVRLVVLANVAVATLTPEQMRRQFRDAIATAIHRARAAGRIELAIAEELLRAVPPSESRS